jgi:gamma-glutamylcyclotransferase (GGCT)/AIG2-like uncharacterized protein YtfP
MTHDPQPGAVRAFFVYGTLMQGECNHAVVARHGLVRVRAAHVRGELFDTGEGYPAMTLSRADSTVWGELIEPADAEAAMRSMDELEQYEGPGASGNLYERVLVNVTLDADGSTAQAWTYICAQDVPPGQRLASGHWRQVSGTRAPVR